MMDAGPPEVGVMFASDGGESVRTPYYRAPPEPSPTQPPAPGKKKKATKDHIPRPANAFILFRADFTKNHKLPDGIEKNNGSLSKIASSEWKSLSPEARRFWDARAEDAKKEHQAMYPDYKYRPVHGKNSKHKPKELVGVWKDNKEETDAPKEEPSPADDRWMEGCSTFSVWQAEGDGAPKKPDSNGSASGKKPKPRAKQPRKTPAKKKQAKPKPSSSSSRLSQPGPDASPEEREAYDRRCEYLAQLAARGVTGDAFEIAKQAWDDAHRTKPGRPSPTGGTPIPDATVDADETEDEASDGPESESDMEGSSRRAPAPYAPPPGNAPPRVVSSASFAYERPLYTTETRPTFREPTPERSTYKEPTPEPETERVGDYPRSFARGEGAPAQAPSRPFATYTPDAPYEAPRRDSYVRGSNEPADVEMQDGAPVSSKRKRSPRSDRSSQEREKDLQPQRESSPAKRPRHDSNGAPSDSPRAKEQSPLLAQPSSQKQSPTQAPQTGGSSISSLTTADGDGDADGEVDADGDFDMDDGTADDDEDELESEDTDYEDGQAKPKPKSRLRAKAKAAPRKVGTQARAKSQTKGQSQAKAPAQAKGQAQAKGSLAKRSPPRYTPAVSGTT
ncbi:hypothetical protein BD626DRAFT_634377 [Schizophyllum amplum]|uniref:HMG box domain-containing protein n=1 Tax=Schizophyllum amplum TaxID=97359 RepID=A0A550BZQ7_9AGAR|nr:hypothetical protein BD626DRAFT_634377 [Auriculariopsis ampla]